ncbi:hypothetical protein [Trinickia diaoshuihuensis]|uniref:hypothetical protein n=1 Tax=Trinickia diaoshuihuensis TaxID=2292265 RepID=UPI001967D0D8|nr:hypothetical protein [Trinickia diaoshuihuensis]
MNPQSLTRALLRLRLALARFGTGHLAAGAALVCAALLWLCVLPGMAARVEDETRAAAHLATLPPPRPAISAPELAADRLAGFYRGLGDSAHTGEIVTRLFEAAAAAGVTLDKAEYKPGHDTAGRFDTYTIVLPVKGDYAKLRQFSEKVLLAVPYAALDDMRFKRGSANDAGVEANLRFTAFLRPVTIAPLSASEVAAIETAAASGASAAAAVAHASGAAVSAVWSASAPQAMLTIDMTRRAPASTDGFVPLPTWGAVSPHPLAVAPVRHGEAPAAKPMSAGTSAPKTPVTLPALAAESASTHSTEAKPALGGSARMAALAAAAASTISTTSAHHAEAKPASAVPALATAPVHVIDMRAQPGGSTRRFTEIAIVSPGAAAPASASAAPPDGGAP